MEIMRAVQASSNDNLKMLTELQQQMSQLQSAMNEMMEAKAQLDTPEMGPYRGSDDLSCGKETQVIDPQRDHYEVRLRYTPRLLKNDLSGRILCLMTRMLTAALHQFLFPGRHSSGLYYPFDLICDELESMGIFRGAPDGSHFTDNNVNVVRERWMLLQQKYSLDSESIQDFKMVMTSVSEEYNPLVIPNLTKDMVVKAIDTFMPDKDSTFNTSCKQLTNMWEDIVVNRALDPDQLECKLGVLRRVTYCVKAEEKYYTLFVMHMFPRRKLHLQQQELHFCHFDVIFEGSIHEEI